MANYDTIGSVIIMKFDGKVSERKKLREAKKLLDVRKNVKTVLEKVDKVKGRLRTIKTRFLAGEDTREAVHKENGCVFRLNVGTCYFSPRLSEDRKQLAMEIKKKDKVLVMFAGVNPYGIVIAKQSGADVTAIELGKQCCKYAEENAEINKVKDKVTLLQGDVKKIVPKLKSEREKFDVVVMPRPNLKEGFVKEAFEASKKGTRVYYYCFGKDMELHKSLKEIYMTAKEKKKKIKIDKIKKVGNIAPYTFRYRIDFKILS